MTLTLKRDGSTLNFTAVYLQQIEWQRPSKERDRYRRNSWRIWERIDSKKIAAVIFMNKGRCESSISENWHLKDSATYKDDI